MADSERQLTDDDRTERAAPGSTGGPAPLGEGIAAWVAASTLRVGLALVGLVLLLFALGQVAGLDLLGLTLDALGSRVGRWLVVAFVALVIIAVAARGFGRRTR